MLLTQFKTKLAAKSKQMRSLVMALLPVVALTLGIPDQQVWAEYPFCVIELDEAEVYIEYNSTDDDRGIQFFWDGEAWKRMRVRNESGKPVIDVVARRNAKAQGLAEGFFESDEPTGEELPAEEFFARFPEGEYKFRGRALDGCWLVSEAELTHDLPIPVVIHLDDFPTIEWTQPPGGPEVVGYEVVVELVVIEGDDERVFVDTATFPGFVTEFTVSPEFLDLIQAAVDEEIVEEFKIELIAREQSGNKTITEQEVDLEE